ncbi:hypothetical protein KAU32_03500 [bacterium]|nr:hypothetical protein [bacterium]
MSTRAPPRHVKVRDKLHIDGSFAEKLRMTKGWCEMQKRKEMDSSLSRK